MAFGQTPGSPGRSSAPRNKRGASIVELAVALPLLMLLVLGVADFSRAYYTAIALANAARAGAAYGAQSNAKSGDAAGIKQAATQEAQNTGLPLSNVSSTRVCQCPNGSSVSCTTGTCTNFGVPQVFVRVTASDTFTTLVNYPGIPHNIPMTRGATVRLQ